MQLLDKIVWCKLRSIYCYAIM